MLATRFREPRRTQFLAGRALAAAALDALGASSMEVARAEDGAPLWPPGMVGSIAHDAHHAAVMAAHAPHWLALGVDVEPDQPLPDDAATLILTDDERAALNALTPGQPLRHARLWFGAKECVHKALHPLRGAWLEFSEVRITLTAPEAEAGRWSATPLSALAQLAFADLQLEGHWWRQDGALITLLGVRG